MSLAKYFESITSNPANNRLPGLLVLSVLALMWGSSTYAGSCDPVVGGVVGKGNDSAIYSSCTTTVHAVENTVAIKHNSLDGTIDTIITAQSAFTPPAPASTASIGTLVNFYGQDMDTGYSGDCRDMKGRLNATPAAVGGHYYCFRFDGTDADLYLGASYRSLTDSLGHGTASIVYPPTADEFITTWQTDNPGTSSATSITVPMVGGPYDVDWDNDGIFDDTGLSGSTTKDYGSAGTYTVRIRGTYDSIQFANGGDKEKILSVDQWGTNVWTSMSSAFWGAVNLTVPAIDTPDFSSVKVMTYMFRDAALVNPDTSAWNTSSVTIMIGVFQNATSASPDTKGWNTSSVEKMQNLFSGATSANPDTSGWDTSAVKDMSGMFEDATSADPDTSAWSTSAVTSMFAMFSGATSANPGTSAWNTSAVTSMAYMFFGATSADPDTRGWDTSKVKSMTNMFTGATSANPDVSGWDTSAVTSMFAMFYGATSFDRDIGSWNVSALESAINMFTGVALSTANYDSLLVGWNAQVLQSGVTFSGGNSTYCSAEAIAARANMIASDSWAITDGGQNCVPQETCNVNMVTGGTENFDATHEACEMLSFGPDYIAVDGITVTANSGWEIDFLPGFTVEQGATLNANVCGQSLCMDSPTPMPLGCHSCVDLICTGPGGDASCCGVAFDQSCVDMVGSMCHLVCEE